MSSRARGFDLQAHRGGAGLRPENTLEAFGHALDLGVTTLELDVHLTVDGVPVVLHDRRLGAGKYADTGPVVPGDPFFPYVGGLVAELTVAQLQTLDAGGVPAPAFPDRVDVPGARIPRLVDLFALVAARGAQDVRFNIETKFDALAPHETAPRERFADILARTVREAGLVERVSVQAFDWELLRLVSVCEPRLRRNVLAAPKYLEPGPSGGSPWLGGVDLAVYAGDVVAAAAAQGFDAISPAHGYPFRSGVDDPGYTAYTTRELVAKAHAAGLDVLPYTVDDPATMRALVDAGVDGLITNRPDRLREVLAGGGLPLPTAYPEETG